MTLRPDPMRTFKGPGEMNEGLKKIWKEFTNLKTAKTADMVLDRIRSAFKKYLESDSLSVDSKNEDDINDWAVAELTKNFKENEKRDGIRNLRVNLFMSTLDDDAGRDAEKRFFETSPRVANITVKALCSLDPKMAFEATASDDIKRVKSPYPGYTPFEAAAERGATELVKVMISKLYDELSKKDGSDTKAAARVYIDKPRKQGSRTAFLMAAENRRLGVLQFLLEDEKYGYPDLANLEGLLATIQEPEGDVEPANNDQPGSEEPGLEVFKYLYDKMDPTTLALNRMEMWNKAVEAPSLTIVKYLLQLPEKDQFINYDCARTIIEKGTVQMWESYGESALERVLKEGERDLLHKAVEYSRVEIVQAILDRFPKQIQVFREIKVKVTKDGKEQIVSKLQYPMQMLTEKDPAKRRDTNSSYYKIRNLLLHAMIKSTSRDMEIKDIRNILRESKVEANTICLHLSSIDTEEQSFGEYVEWLQAQSPNTGDIFIFESILRYANFPDLHTQTPKNTEDVTSSMQTDYREVTAVFEWLKARKVDQVLELSVPDRLLCPHSDDDVAYCVNGWGIRALKWRKLDLFLGNLTDTGRENLQELHLFSSGNRAVYERWIQDLTERKSFPKLKKLRVFVVKDVMSDKRVQKVKESLQTQLDSLNRALGYPWTSKPQEGKPEPAVYVREFDWAKDRVQKEYRNLDDITNDVVGPNLGAFIRSFKAATLNKEIRRTRVALIDSGVVIVGGKRTIKAEARRAALGSAAQAGISQANGHPLAEGGDAQQMPGKGLPGSEGWWTNDLAKQVVRGKSFVDTGNDEEHVWWHSSEPHGTQMARLICSMDPRCALYVAKVAETRSSGVSANIVAEAIRWAIEEDVDIISLSLVAYENTADMAQAIREAKARDIVILSSTGDEGVRDARDAVKTERIRQHLFTIAACDRWGNLLDRSQKEDYDFRFVGNNVQVGQVPFLHSSESISGSSVATAIAAGTASLIAECCRLSERCNLEGDWQTNPWRCDMVRDRFTMMAQESGQNYVLLENLCGPRQNLQTADFATTVKESFTWNYVPRK